MITNEQALEEAIRLLNGVVFNGTTYEQDLETVKIVRRIKKLKDSIKKQN